MLEFTNCLLNSVGVMKTLVGMSRKVRYYDVNNIVHKLDMIVSAYS